MIILLDTHLVLWIVAEPEKLPKSFREMIEPPEQSVFFSAANVWEIAIKSNLHREDFVARPAEILAELSFLEIPELPIRATHCSAVRTLPPLHRDPFDRILIAQAITEQMVLYTVDAALPGYGEMVHLLSR